MNCPELSVIIYSDGDRHKLTPTLSSLSHVGIDPSALDVIVVNDSAEQLTALTDTAREELPRLTVLDNDRTAGVAASRARGLAVAAGTSVTFIDSGSWFAPGGLAALLAQQRQADVDIVYGDIIVSSGLVRSTTARVWSRLNCPTAHNRMPLPPGITRLPAPRIQVGAVFRASAGPLLELGDHSDVWAWRVAVSPLSFTVADTLVAVIPDTDPEYASARRAQPDVQQVLQACHRVMDVITAMDQADAEAPAARADAGEHGISRRQALSFIALCECVDRLQQVAKGNRVQSVLGMRLQRECVKLLQRTDPATLRRLAETKKKSLTSVMSSALSTALSPGRSSV